MARIYRAYDGGAEAVPLSRELIEEFPDAPLDPDSDPGEEEEEEIDPEELRAQVLAEAREEAQRLVHEAYEEGLKRGMEAGEKQFRDEVATAAQALEAAAAAITQAREEFLSRLEGEVVAITRAIVERVVIRESSTDPELVARLARRALVSLTDEEDVRLHVNPADKAALQAHRVKLLEEFHSLKRLIIEADDTVERGGCVAQTKSYHADFQPGALLDCLFEDVFGEGRENG